MRRLLLLLTAAVALAGCSTPIAGSPSPADPAAAPGGITLPPRPRELRLDDIDPCTLLTPAQRVELGLDGRAESDVTDAPYFAGPRCTIVAFEPREIGLGLVLSTGSGIDELLVPGVIGDDVTTTTVSDFPAVIAKPGITDACAVDVDVAEGQFIDVQLRDVGKNPAIPQEQLCQDALRIAEAAVSTLQRT